MNLRLLPWRMRLADLRGRGIYAGYPNRYRCIFIHIPKTAGSSVATALFGEQSRHLPYYEYEQANSAKFNKFFKFSFVRNPWDRLVSTFFFLRKGGMNALDHDWAIKNIALFNSFDEFVLNWATPKNIRSWVHFLPQSHFVLNEKGRVMVDFLGRFERLDDDFAHVAASLGRDIMLPKTNRSTHNHYSTYYTAQTRKIVQNIYAQDIQAFGYHFDG